MQPEAVTNHDVAQKFPEVRQKEQKFEMFIWEYIEIGLELSPQMNNDDEDVPQDSFLALAKRCSVIYWFVVRMSLVYCWCGGERT